MTALTGRGGSAPCTARGGSQRGASGPTSATLKYVLCCVASVLLLHLFSISSNCVPVWLAGGAWPSYWLSLLHRLFTLTTSFAACPVTDISHIFSGPVIPCHLVSVHPPAWTISLFRPLA